MMAKRVFHLLVVAMLLLGLCGAPGHVSADESVVPDPGFGLGLVPSEGAFPQLSFSSILASTPSSVPPAVDLSAYLPPVGSQGPQGSCVGWALAYYLKSFQERVERGWDTSFPTHQYSPAYVYNLRPTSSCSNDAGMSFLSGLRILRDNGAAPLSSFPYNPSDPCTKPSDAVQQEAWAYRIASFSNVFAQQGQADLALLKALLAAGQPIAMAVPVYSSFYSVTYDQPVVSRPASGETLYGGHAMLVVGYDDAIGGFKAVNSWGPFWGRNGFCYLSYDFVQNNVWEGWIMEDHVEPLAPATFRGSVLIDGQNAPEGTPVTARVGNTQVAATLAKMGTSGSTYELVVPADNPTTPEREGATVGDLVQIAVEGRTVAFAVWSPNEAISVDLALMSSAPSTEFTLFVPTACR